MWGVYKYCRLLTSGANGAIRPSQVGFAGDKAGRKSETNYI